MRLLVLGGTRFLGRSIVDEAVSRGYDVTTFTRGQSGHPRPGAEALHGDRTSAGDLTPLAGREWDGVIDTSVLAPEHVAASARALAGQARHYTYISSISAYAGFPAEPVTEDSPVVEGTLGAEGNDFGLEYSLLKVGSERAAAEAFPGRSLIVRPGLIVGPHENVGRLPWWLARFAAGGTVLAPGAPGRPVQVTDARDLAAWVVDNTRRGIFGVVNVPGPEGTTMGQLLAACAHATAAARTGGGGADSERHLLRWVPDSALVAAGVEEDVDLPLWAPDTPENAGVWQVAGDRALRTGIRYRPLADTVHDTWLWMKQEGATTGKPPGEVGRREGIGMTPNRERAILATLPPT
ncbi:MAG TPA: NAD-dependent epimerase/dehydratase family protein [Streptosporangiaceae bacterium]